MRTNNVFLLIFLLVIGFVANAQTIVWTGLAANNDFFDEGNWINSTTNSPLLSGTIDFGLPINLALEIKSSITVIEAKGVINLGTGSLSISSANLTADSFSAGNITVNENAYIDLSSINPLSKEVQINFTSGIGWIKTLNYSSRLFSINNIGQVKVNGNPSVYKSNLRLDNYYLNGCVIRSNTLSSTPLMVYDGINLQGNVSSISVNTIHSGAAIANSMNNKIESFILKKGFMVTFAVESDGTGKSKNYIASDEDLVINSLPKAISSSISFIRVLPWSWVSKKGIGGTITGLDETWFYRWLNTGESTVDREYAPMCFGLSGANDSIDILLYRGKYKATHVMGFNEPDNCNDQGGVNGGCIIANAVTTYKNLMKTGLRMVSPSGTEGAGTGWLKDFYNSAKNQDVRIDVIAVHWYDWGSNPKVNNNPTAQEVFNRFKTYLSAIHKLYGLPIWITEFNANPHRSTEVNLGFMKLALPYLESLDYIERYAWFQPSSGVANYYDAEGNYTDVGTYYKNFNTTPSIPEPTVNAGNNLNLSDYPNIALMKIATPSSTFSTLISSNALDGNTTIATSQWNVNFGLSGGTNYSPLPAWLEVDLLGNYKIEGFRTFEASKAMKNFRFEVWDSTLNAGAGGWKSVVTTTNNPATSLTTFKTFTPVTTTKIRLYITEHNNTDYLKLFELEVYGFLAPTLSNSEFEKDNPFRMYPNPVTNGVVNISGLQTIDSVEVFTISGAKMSVPYDNGQIQVSELKPGVYLLKINKTLTYKFIKM